MRTLSLLGLLLVSCVGKPPVPCTTCGSSETCVDLMTDVRNCGGCGVACTPGSVCLSGLCMLSCPAPLTQCANTCADTRFDPTNCGGCGRTCGPTETCTNSTCRPTCPAGQTSCVDAAGELRCAALATDGFNCGACGRACGIGQACVAGTCTTQCQQGQQLCSNDGGLAGCTSVATDRENCGSCGRQCTTGEVCSNGFCTTSCGAGLATCEPDGGARYCASLGSDNANCGVCGRGCRPNESCLGGGCTNICGAQRTLCATDAGTTYCADTRVDPTNCGACGAECQPGTICLGSVCQGFCGAGRTFCPAGSYCTDTRIDPLNCGSCGTTCSPGQSCQDGGCSTLCGTGRTQCLLSDGGAVCVDTTTDPTSCGACGRTCAAGLVCVLGRCTSVGFPQSCDELQQSRGATLANGEYRLFFRNQPHQPYQGYCFQTDAGTALTYLTLDRPGGNDNYSEFDNTNLNPAVSIGPRCVTYWQRYRFDPSSAQIITDDFTFSASDGGNLAFQVFRTDVGFAFDCSCGPRTGDSSIDLRGTPFTIDPSNQWQSAGFNHSGSVTLSHRNQVARIVGGGCCGENQIRSNSLGTTNLLLRYHASSCATLKAETPSLQDGVYELAPLGSDAGVRAYCDMTAEDGGWTLVLKVDGNNAASQFFYDSPLWTGMTPYNPESLDLSRTEARLVAYQTVPARELRIVTVSDAGVTRAVSVGLAGPGFDSLRAAVAGGSHVPFSRDAGAAAWAGLFQPGATLQANCNREGLNVEGEPAYARVRIGIVANNENDCATNESYAGVGGRVSPSVTQNPTRMPPVYCYPPLVNFAGYSAGAIGGGTMANTFECVSPGTANAAQFTYVFVR